MASRTNSKAVKIWKTAAYIRISKEDAATKNGTKNVSESVVNQKQLIGDFIASQNDLGDYSTFVDDGATGTNFERDGFQQMMEEIRKGNINCVVVKDLSRLGRNYTGAGDYMEQIFPMLGVRFIAINDNVDSFLRPAEMETILIPIKNLLNDSYSRDLSTKVKSALTSKRKNGEFIGSLAPYGYLKDPEDKNKLLIDTEVADNVRNIFKWYAEGMSKLGLVRKLNSLHILSPSEYRISKYPAKKKYNVGQRKNAMGLWNIHTLSILLTNPTYCGHMAQGKFTNVSYKNNKRVVIPQDEWIVVKNTHEPIVTEDLFEKVQDQLERNTRAAPGKDHVNLFAGFLSCADCKRTMCRSSNKTKNGKTRIYYRCATNMRQSHEACTTHNISENVLEAAVLSVIQAQISLFLDMDKLLQSLNVDKRRNSQLVAIERQLATMQSQIDSTEHLRIGLYADLKRGILTEEEYLSLKSAYTKELESYRQAVSNLQEERQSLDMQDALQNVWVEKFKQNKNIDILTRDILIEFVDRIYIHEGKKITIMFKFQDELERMARILDDEQVKAQLDKAS